MFVGLVARAEIELGCAFGDRLEQDLSQKYFARRVPRQPDVKAGNAPKIAPLVTQPKVVRNRLPVPRQTCKSQPSLGRRLARQLPVVCTLPLVAKQTGMRCHGSSCNMLFKKIVQTRRDGGGVTPMVDMQSSIPTKEAFV